ncbi:D-amino-acid transaminase, chloroplastic [Selaginella moellendorffii]|uniref:D-amino-acid transaminase, chloroplastic n=1 Tax=Selaginella moellendorffii TaxID=88036 RepID=UPI000D1C8A6B|nr:D-amino-acid transaminase, chloroplastic [Selaginella moellendorffii]|eukprot:XP_002982973.2 D-amino-acid transaminase, chloroplastic [Selaginella moellendorffii]
MLPQGIYFGSLLAPNHPRRCSSLPPLLWRQRSSSIVAMVATTDSSKIVPVLSISEVTERLKSHSHDAQKTYRAMYSSLIDGITTDPAAMVIPMDDHMVHRGHGVFDTATIADGYLYELDAHLDRFHKSAAAAKIQPPFDRATMREILIQTVASSGCKLGSLRYWLSAGPGGFGLSSSECTMSTLYAVVLSLPAIPDPDMGVTVITASTPMKHPQFATMKNVNYLPNALSKLEAESQGAFAAIWLDDEGFVAEGPNVNVAFISKSRELLVPEFDKILSGCTARRTVALAPKLVESGVLSAVKVTKISPEQAKDCPEMMLIGSTLPITPVVKWDGQVIGNGEAGPATIALRNLVVDDILNGPSALRIPVPYTGEA